MAFTAVAGLWGAGLSGGSKETVLFRYVLAWVPMVVIAVANGALRQLTFAKHLSEPQAHQLSTLIGSVGMGLYIRWVIRRWPLASGRQALSVGALWVLLTVTFETFMGLVLQQRSLGAVFGEYNLLAGARSKLHRRRPCFVRA